MESVALPTSGDVPRYLFKVTVWSYGNLRAQGRYEMILEEMRLQRGREDELQEDFLDSEEEDNEAKEAYQM